MCNSGDLDLDGTFEAVTFSEFSIDCGCSSGTTTDNGDVIPAPSPPAPTPPLGTDSCGDGDAFTIISDEFPETEGCYLDSGRTEEGEPVYTLTGTPFLGQQTVFASVEDDTDEVLCLKYITAQPSQTIWTCQLFHARTIAHYRLEHIVIFSFFFSSFCGGEFRRCFCGWGERVPPSPK